MTGSAARLASATFAGLAVATVAAFFLSSILKSQPSVLDGIERTKFFSPNGDGVRDVQRVSFTMDESDEISVDVVDVEGTRLKRLLEDRDVERGDVVRVRWDGREDGGGVAPDGEYSIRVILQREGRAILAPRPFELDTRPPAPAVVVAEDAGVVAPGETVAFAARRVPPESAPTFTIVRTDVPSDPEPVREIPGSVGTTDYEWDGRDDAGVPVPQGTYLIRVTASDLAGNAVTLPALPLNARAIAGRPGVTVRTLAVQPPVTPARSGGQAGFSVDSGGRPYRWRLRRVGDPEVVRRGRRRGRPTLVVDLPFGPSGLFVLTVTAGGQTTRVPLAVQARAGRPLLLVVPMISWLGQDPVDTSGDGVPDTFATGAAVSFPRPFQFTNGLPPGFGRQIAPLLKLLDAAGYNYDLTTDIALARDEQPAEDRSGVLFLGAPQWTSLQVAERLRGYVRQGGQVALFGPRALRASVQIGARRLENATPPTPQDALGGRVADVRERDDTAPLSVLAEDESLQLFEGFAGLLPGITEVEELLEPGDGEVVASVGEESTDLIPAFSAVRAGDGLVIRVGLPEWGPRLEAEDPNVQQLTYNIVDVLRGARPRARGAN